jgi:ribonuclease-3
MLSFLKKIISRSSQSGSFLTEIESITGVVPQNEQLYQLAFTHSSSSLEDKQGNKLNNERLEFLGDSILGAIVTDYLYRIYPDKEEGYLTSLRSKLVSRKHLNELGDIMGLRELLSFTPASGTRAKSLNGDAFEALIGAIYLDLGYDACQQFLEGKVLPSIDLEQLAKRFTSFKSELLEWGQKEKHYIHFELLQTEGKSHDPIYLVACYKGKEELGQVQGPTKKKAEEESARAAFQTLNLLHGKTKT